MTRHAVTRLITCFPFFDKKKTDIITPTGDTVDIVCAVLVERNFARSFVTQPGFAIGVFITVGTDRQQLDHLTNGSLQDGVSFITTTVPIGTVAVVGTADQRGKWLQFALLLVHYTFIAMMTMTKIMEMMVGGIDCKRVVHDGQYEAEQDRKPHDRKERVLAVDFCLMCCGIDRLVDCGKRSSTRSNNNSNNNSRCVASPCFVVTNISPFNPCTASTMPDMQ